MSVTAKRLTTLLRGGGFSPASISNLVAWWDMITPSLLFQASDGTGAVTSASDPVGYVTDKSGGGRHFTQGTALNKFAYQSGGGILCDGSNDSMLATVSPSVTFTAQTIFLVLKDSGTAISNERGFSQSASTTADYNLAGHYVPLARSGLTGNWGAYASNGFRATVAVTAATKSLLVATHSGSAIVNRVNGSAGSSYSHSLNLTIDKFGIGRPVNDTAPSSAITIYEILVYSKLVTGTELTAIESYLMTRHGIS